MDSDELEEEAVELLQELELKEYEAKSFVALSWMSSGTAKMISDTMDGPRTRVYGAIRVLEAKGLVEVKHSNPRSSGPSRSRSSPCSVTGSATVSW